MEGSSVQLAGVRCDQLHNELGLEAPGHHQADSPLDPAARAKGLAKAHDKLTTELSSVMHRNFFDGRHDASPLDSDPGSKALDLTQAECDALTAYVASRPPPIAIEPTSPRQSSVIADGKMIFHSIGCTVCHTQSLGEIQDIYSDLLLHDMGPDLSDQGEYYNDLDEPDSLSSAKVSEWRAPPLWGVRDTAPYLHDGRAATLQQAIVQHGGQAAESALISRRSTRLIDRNCWSF